MRTRRPSNRIILIAAGATAAVVLAALYACFYGSPGGVSRSPITEAIDSIENWTSYSPVRKLAGQFPDYYPEQLHPELVRLNDRLYIRTKNSPYHPRPQQNWVLVVNATVTDTDGSTQSTAIRYGLPRRHVHVSYASLWTYHAVCSIDEIDITEPVKVTVTPDEAQYSKLGLNRPLWRGKAVFELDVKRIDPDDAFFAN